MSWKDFFKKIIQIIIEALKPNPNTTTTTTATSVGPSNDEAAHGLDWTKVKFIYGDWSCPNAKPTLKMKEAKMNGGTAHLVWDDPRGKWAGNNNPPGGGCSAGCFMVIKQSDGSWIGGRFDDIGFGSPIGNGLVVDDRPLQHIWDQENVPDYPRRWRCPANGSEVAFVLVSFDGSVHQFGKERTTAGFTIWNR